MELGGTGSDWLGLGGGQAGLSEEVMFELRPDEGDREKNRPEVPMGDTEWRRPGGSSGGWGGVMWDLGFRGEPRGGKGQGVPKVCPHQSCDCHMSLY